MSAIAELRALEILDSRGNPTVQATCVLASGAAGTVSVPSGASTGAGEAHELRDGNPSRYGGRGCRRAVAAVEGEIAAALRGRELAGQEELDRALLELDGSADKSRLGANAILAVSLAFARASAAELGRPLYEHFASLVGETPDALPRPEINLFSGGRHAGGQVAVQDVLVVPTGATTMDEALATTADAYRSAARLVLERYGMRELTADEGGLAPDFPDTERMLADASEAVAGLPVSLSIDVAASQLRGEDGYRLDGETLTGAEMVERVARWAREHEVVAVEDGVAEDDWDDWVALRAALPAGVLAIGDDLLCTSASRIRRAVELGAADALLLKVNQVGTLTEAAEARALAREAGWRVVVSARSGETEDDWLADLAVGWRGDLIKIGSIRQSERLAKYNRLLAIERETGLPLAPRLA
ncbi:MAG TPA: enolase C-terminal domain-like protein [Gaiellaceae bacterium]|nr:enolase C-terminal domain-like protein [Gaiellaceae bacterium]